jgi:hypothetical protein
MTYDEIRAAARRYQAALPDGQFPPLPHAARTNDTRQWDVMMHALARLWQTPAQPADVLAFEAQTYIATRQNTCRHTWVTVNDHRRPEYRECIHCDRHER